jgi:hypothetical protein
VALSSNDKETLEDLFTDHPFLLTSRTNEQPPRGSSSNEYANRRMSPIGRIYSLGKGEVGASSWDFGGALRWQ